MRPRSARQADSAKKFEGEAVSPIVIPQLQKIAALGGARIVDHDVDAAKMFHGELGKLGGALGETQIERGEGGDSAVAFDLLDSGSQRRHAGAQDGLRALFRQTIAMARPMPGWLP